MVRLGCGIAPQFSNGPETVSCTGLLSFVLFLFPTWYTDLDSSFISLNILCYHSYFVGIVLLLP